MAVVEEQIVVVDEWRGLYSESWKGVIVDDAFAHPAKFSRALIRKIYDHVTAEGWAKSGDRVIDPFGGVALGGFDAMQHGLYWHGCELEEKFVGLGNQNIALWNERFSGMPNWGVARLIQGDSRRLTAVWAGASLCVTSPPYADGCAHTGGDDPKPENLQGGAYHGVGLSITSPPYANETVNDRNGIDHSLIKKPGGRNSQSRTMAGYGEASGQLGNLAISSPPFESSTQVNNTPGDITAGAPRWEGGRDSAARVRQDYADYGADNLGNERGETFWSASRLILEQLHQVLTPNAHAVFVVKAFVRDKKIVDFPGQWAQLCEAVGFKLLHDHHALLTENYGTQRGFESDKQLRVERKSFFRRLAEQKGSPRIDYENVLCFRKVA